MTLASLARQQNDETERALWAAVRALEESAARSERLARRGDVELRGRFAEKAGTERRQADQIRRILLRDNILPASVRGKSGGES